MFICIYKKYIFIMLYLHIFHFETLQDKDLWLLHYYRMYTVRMDIIHRINTRRPELNHIFIPFSYHRYLHKYIQNIGKWIETPSTYTLSNLINDHNRINERRKNISIWYYYYPFSCAKDLWKRQDMKNELNILSTYKPLMYILLYQKDYHHLYILFTVISFTKFCDAFVSLMRDKYTLSCRPIFFITFFKFMIQYNIRNQLTSNHNKLMTIMDDKCNEFKRINDEINSFLSSIHQCYTHSLERCTTLPLFVITIIVDYLPYF